MAEEAMDTKNISKVIILMVVLFIFVLLASDFENKIIQNPNKDKALVIKELQNIEQEESAVQEFKSETVIEKEDTTEIDNLKLEINKLQSDLNDLKQKNKQTNNISKQFTYQSNPLNNHFEKILIGITIIPVIIFGFKKVKAMTININKTNINLKK